MIRIGIAGCGRVARIHVARMLTRGDVEIVGLADPDESAARSLAETALKAQHGAKTFTDHREMLAEVAPDAVAVFAPHRTHYQVAMDALQAGCHLFIEKPLSTNPQEASDIVGLAKGRMRVVAIGHQFRLRPSLLGARKLLKNGEIGPVRMVTATLSESWLARHQEKSDAWRLDPRLSGGGILADAGDHLLDALLWTTGQTASEVAALQTRHAPGLDIVTSAVIRLADGTPASVAISGVCGSPFFELAYYGELGRICAHESTLMIHMQASPERQISLPPAGETIDGDFISALRNGSPPCCPAEDALETVRLQEAITRSAISNEVVKLS